VRLLVEPVSERIVRLLVEPISESVGLLVEPVSESVRLLVVLVFIFEPLIAVRVIRVVILGAVSPHVNKFAPHVNKFGPIG
jgi:hypothetical protein